MAATINDQVMTTDTTPHTARLAPGQDHLWDVTWLPGRRVTRSQAITQVAAKPAWTVTAETTPERPDPQAGE